MIPETEFINPLSVKNESAADTSSIEVEVVADVPDQQVNQIYQEVLEAIGTGSCCYDPRWLGIISQGLHHRPFLLVCRQANRPVGMLPLVLVKSLIFGRFLVSLPYANSGGVIADNCEVSRRLIDRAVELADELNVRHLELRHEKETEHPALTHRLTSKVHMRLALPGSVDELWQKLSSKVKNKVRKGEKQAFTEHWGGLELLEDFYSVFSQNMRDLGTPVFGRRLFQAILAGFPNAAEFCVIRSGNQPVAAGLLIHGQGVTLVPSASSLKSHNSTNANDWMYWKLQARAVERGQRVFDFGRCTIDGNTFVFKKKWGAEPEPAIWQYYVRKGDVGDMRPDNAKYNLAIRVWQKLPLRLTCMLGPSIIRGIP